MEELLVKELFKKPFQDKMNSWLSAYQVKIENSKSGWHPKHLGIGPPPKLENRKILSDSGRHGCIWADILQK